MSRLVYRPVCIEGWRGESPSAYRDDLGVHAILCLIDSWAECGDWWAGEGTRTLYRIVTADQAVVDLERSQADGQWRLYRIWD